MATAGSQETTCKIVFDSNFKLETKDKHPEYTGIAVMANKVLITDFVAEKIYIFNRQDGNLLCTERPEGEPRDICVLGNTQFAVCLRGGQIVIMALTSDGVTRIKTVDVSKGFSECCYSLSKWMEEKMIVSGWRRKKSMFCWAVIGKDGCIDTIHDICTGISGFTKVTTKDNTIYVSYSDTTKSGVYAFQVSNPDKPQFVYQHKELKRPGSIIADKGSVFVCDLDSNVIHQVSDTGHLVIKHTIQLPVLARYYDDQHGRLYTTSRGSNEITSYKFEYLHPSAQNQTRDTVVRKRIQLPDMGGIKRLPLLPEYKNMVPLKLGVPRKPIDVRLTMISKFNPIVRPGGDHKKTLVKDCGGKSFQGVPLQYLTKDDRSMQCFEDDLKKSHNTVFSIRILVAGETSIDKMTLVKRLLGDTAYILEGSGKESIDVYVRCLDVSLKVKLHRRVLNKCLSQLMHDLDIKLALIYIEGEEILDALTIRDIRDQKTTSDSILKLLDNIKQQPWETYEKFKECLVKANQENLKKILEETEKNLSEEISQAK